MLTLDSALARTADITALATRAGADAADALYYCDASTQVEVRLGALEDVQRAEGEEIGLRVFVGKRSASVSTSDFDPARLGELVARAVAMAREAPEDAYAGLAPEDMLLRGDAPDLDLDDGSDADPEALRATALASEDAARGVAGVTNSEGGSAAHNRVRIALATSHGFARAYGVTGHSVSASVLAGQGGDMQRDYDWHSARHLADLDAPATIGAKAGERAVRRMNPGRLDSGAMPVVFDPRVGSSLVGHLIGAISGPAITRRTSFLLDALGTRVFAPGISIVEDPLRPRGLSSRPFDGEGLETHATRIIDDGMLPGWLLDSASARQLGLVPTGHASRGIGGAPGVSPANLHIAPGAVSPAALIADIADGVLVTELIGHGVNPVTGDYSRGASGFRIVGGEIAGPVAEFTVAGNLKDMFAALVAADDLVFRHGTNVPTLRCDAMTVASS
ncbi:MAG: TldD/PmbA family protein [Sphingomonadales bacterium]|nr:TldD/PmbA family protein [Sphingomonadales bacterium]